MSKAHSGSNAHRTAVSDSNGSFVIPDLLDGPYLLAIQDSIAGYFHDFAKMPEASLADGPGVTPSSGAPDSLRPYIPLGRVNLAKDSTRTVNIRAPRPGAELLRFCGRRVTADRPGVLAVRVLDGRAGAGKAHVAATPSEHAPSGPTTGRTDAEGRSILCGIPVGVPMIVSATIDRRPPATALLTLDATSPVKLQILQLRQ